MTGMTCLFGLAVLSASMTLVAARRTISTSKSTTAETIANIVWTDAPGSVCNDGSPYAFYYREATTQPTRWVFHLQGGFWCWDADSCGYRAETTPSMVTSTVFNDTVVMAGGLLSPNEEVNPAFAGAHLVYLPYCTSDAWAGARDTVDEDTGFVFMGLQVVNETVSMVINEFGLGSQGDELLLWSGCSAGGQGVVNTLDFVAGLLDAEGLTDSIRLLGLADAGWMQDFLPLRDGQVSIAEQAQDGLELWQPKFQPNCIEAWFDQPWMCFFSPIVVPFMTTPILVQSNQYDMFQVPWNCCTPPGANATQIEWVDEFAEGTASSMSALLKPPNAAYDLACFHHCLVEDDRLFSEIGPSYDTSRSLSAVLVDWVNTGSYSDSESVSVVETCGFFNCSLC